MSDSFVAYVDEDEESNDRDGLSWSPSDFIYAHSWIRDEPPAHIDDLLKIVKEEEFHQATQQAFTAWIEMIQEMHANDYGQGIPVARFQPDSEVEAIAPLCRSYLTRLQKSGLIDQPMKERILAAALAFGLAKVSLKSIKWITAVVLLCRPNQKTDLAWLKELVYDVRPSQLQ